MQSFQCLADERANFRLKVLFIVHFGLPKLPGQIPPPTNFAKNQGVKTLGQPTPWPYYLYEQIILESFNGKLRDELLNWETFTTLEEAKVLIDQWRREYNQVRPHSALWYRPPAPEVVLAMT